MSSVPMHSLPEDLGHALVRFQEASARLESKHHDLIAEVNQLKERLRLQEAEMKRAERLAMLGETAAALAHEVRNPLGAMKLFLSLLRQDVAGNPRAVKTVDQLDATIGSLNHVVSNILQFSSDKQMTLAPLDLHVVIRRMAKSFKEAYPKIEFTLALEAQPLLMANETALEQVITNLWRNAAQAMRWQGTISVQTVGGFEESLVMRVSDHGGGIPATVLPRIFEPFVTGRSEGTGLGLAIVARLLALHRATIAAANNERGAVFEIVFEQRSKSKE